MPTLRLKLIACVMSGALMGAAGAPSPCTCTSSSRPPTFNLNYSVSVLAMSMIGGTAHWIGPVLGAILLGSMQQLVTVTISNGDQRAGVGVLLVVFVVAAPDGIIGLFRKLGRKRAKDKA